MEEVVTMGIQPAAFRLYSTCNNYPWGRKGNKSLAARMCAATPREDFRVNENEPYSEMWFGDYPDFPARLKYGHDLGHVLRTNTTKLLGKSPVDKFGHQLPYLPKILSIAKALPLQIHPDKALAAWLHQQNPERFPDSNHKPEIAIALSHFELFVGWKPLDRISPLFNTPNLCRLIPHLRGLEGTFRHTNIDPGALVAVLCMNYFVLEAGEAIFIPAGGIHCYISGDIFEGMIM
ncbi:hypothetical protein MY3296_009993 [Beauveria thailandica]